MSIDRNPYTFGRAGYHMRRAEHYRLMHNDLCRRGIGLSARAQRCAELYEHHSIKADELVMARPRNVRFWFVKYPGCYNITPPIARAHTRRHNQSFM